MRRACLCGAQVDATYRVCMKARSYPHEETPLQFQVKSLEAYERQLGETIETMPYQPCDPSTGTCPPTMWMDRCIFVKVAPPQIGECGVWIVKGGVGVGS